jgi:hypothetical protein
VIVPDFAKQGPIVIGGVGGSGTRLIAEIVMDMGFYLGDMLNQSKDLLYFSLLFKRPIWFSKVVNSNEHEIFRGLKVLENRLTTQKKLTGNDIKFIEKVAQTYRNGDLLAQKIKKTMLSPNPINRQLYQGWGWKEPNAHLYLPYIHRYFPNVRYIHVIRNGLNMAFSKNQQQLFNWGPLFGVTIPNNPMMIPNASLTYWIKANERAVMYGTKQMKDRFLLIHFDQLCVNPTPQLQKLAEFLAVDDGAFDEWSEKIDPAAATLKYKEADLRKFHPNDLEKVRTLGFKAI